MEQRDTNENRPRVLYIGVEPIARRGSLGNAVSNLLSSWNTESIARIYLSDVEPDRSLCDKSLRVSMSVFPVDYYIRKMLGNVIRVNHPLVHNDVATGPTAGEKLSLRVHLHLIARALSDIAPCCLPDEAAKWVREFRPHVIYSCFGNARMIKLALKASQVAGNIPIVPHFMDDWPSTLYADGKLFNIPRRAVEELLRKMFEKFPIGLCIGESMAEEYKMRYELEFYDVRIALMTGSSRIMLIRLD